MSTPRAGRNARILIDMSSGASAAATVVSAKNKWSLDQKVDQFDVTEFEATSKTYVVGLPDAQGSIEGFWDSADNTVYNLIGSAVPRKLYIYPDVVNNAGSYVLMTAYFSTKADGAVNSATNFSLSFAAATPAVWVHP